MLRKSAIIYIFLLMIFVSCKIEPKEIEYGKDLCHFCKMTIVEETHAAEIVTKKGRAYKYDSAECMVNETNSLDMDKLELFLVTDYTQPKKLIDAKQATFLISKEIKSPMGAFLTTFSNPSDAEHYEGETYDWDSIREKFKQ